MYVCVHILCNIFRKAPARQAAGGHSRGSPSGEELEGESPRGGDKVTILGEGPLPFWSLF